MNIKIKEIKKNHIPVYKHETDACADCMASVSENKRIVVHRFETVKIPLGFAVEIPEGYEGIIKGRSGLTSKGIFSALGTIDCGYTGEVCAIITNLSNDDYYVVDGDRICQFKIQKAEKIIFNSVDELSDTERGANGFGSSGI